MNNLELYELGRQVPDEAKKPITAGRLKGFTDINPMWRIKRLTEMFGPCGIGWWYEITDKRMEAGANSEMCVFVDIKLFYRWGDTVSQPVYGTGGSSFVAKEKNGMYTSDECFKMALTDAISVAAKAIGVGADVYYAKDRDKYSNPEEPDRVPGNNPSAAYGGTSPDRGGNERSGGTPDRGGQEGGLRPISDLDKPKQDVMFCCADCGNKLMPYTGADGKTVSIRKHAEGSFARYGKVLCIHCIMDRQAAGVME